MVSKYDVHGGLTAPRSLLTGLCTAARLFQAQHEHLPNTAAALNTSATS